MMPRTGGRQSQQGDDLSVRKHRPDYGLIIIPSILLAIGLVIMYAISPALAAQGGNVSDAYFVSRQFIAVILSFIAFWAAQKIPLSFWQKYQIPLLATVFVLSIIAVFQGGREDLRWIQMGAFSFQPVEMVKFLVVVLFAGILVRLIKEGRQSWQAYKVPLIIFAAFSFVIVALQRDLGSTVVLMAMIAVMAYIAGVPLLRLGIFAAIALAVVAMAIGSTAYRRDRFLTFIQPQRDCSDAGYHACQAMIAVGSGGVFGVGIGHSVQAYGYLPEAENDSIFAIYAEKFGFVGSVVFIGIYGALLLRILNVMQRAPNRRAQLISVGVFTWFAVQALVNIGAMVGLLPLKGITLPFISYGGTSLIFAMAALGLVFQISGYTTMRRSSLGFDNERVPHEGSSHWRRDSRPRYTVTRRSV